MHPLALNRILLEHLSASQLVPTLSLPKPSGRSSAQRFIRPQSDPCQGGASASLLTTRNWDDTPSRRSY